MDLESLLPVDGTAIMQEAKALWGVFLRFVLRRKTPIP